MRARMIAARCFGRLFHLAALNNGGVLPMGNADESTSHSLLKRLKAQDSAAWSRMVRIYGPLVYRWCRRTGVVAQDVEDISQNVFQAVSHGIAGFQRDQPGDSFRGWLYGITRNKVNDHFRRQFRSPASPGGSGFQRHLANQVEDLEAPPDPWGEDEALVVDDRLRILHAALELIRLEFAPHNWQAFWQTTILQFPAAEVALRLALTAGAVRQARYRVLRRLRRELEELQEF